MKDIILKYILTTFFILSITGGAALEAKRPEIRVLIMHTKGPIWEEGVDFRKQKGVMDHITHYKKLHDQGKLELGGPFLDNSGGMMITVPDVDLNEMKDFAAADPTVKSGLLKFEVKPWMIGMKK